MRITDHFDSDEFAQHEGFGMDSEAYPEDWTESRLRPLCGVLEAVRTEIDMPLFVISGYRSPEYNSALYTAAGKLPTDSQHKYGRAADIRCPTMAASELHETIFRLYKAGAIQIGGLGKYNSFVHVDIRPQSPPGHLAQWDYSDSAGTDGAPSQGNGASDESEGEAEIGDDTVGWLVTAGFGLMALWLFYMGGR